MSEKINFSKLNPKIIFILSLIESIGITLFLNIAFTQSLKYIFSIWSLAIFLLFFISFNIYNINEENNNLIEKNKKD